NIVFKAAWLLQEVTKTHHGIDIELRKTIPMGGGLGGGSSNAATTLLALNHLWQTRLSTKTLAKLGLQLGADVPVFVEGFAAFATGVGEHLTPIDLPEPWYVIVMPQVAVATHEIFSHPQLTRNAQPITIADFLSHGGQNSCEAVASTLYPEIHEALRWLSQFGNAKMSGTGSAVFASFATKDQADEVINQLPTTFKGVVAKGWNRSPLFAKIDMA
ncbi:MAG: 4-(cytidine 5'-diphospho)-2-C-methyl-D-erythritol kinase, partial [Pseudomonadota bacterium]|nr:4-(cytidine 5'-diphospho)-2-C-methyl-D-erythritol kinase [Pseudomonadota bacterium]